MNTHAAKNKLGQLINEKGYDIKQISELLGYKNRASGTEVINGTKQMPIDKWHTLAKFLGKTIDDIYILQQSKL